MRTFRHGIERLFNLPPHDGPAVSPMLAADQRRQADATSRLDRLAPLVAAYRDQDNALDRLKGGT